MIGFIAGACVGIVALGLYVIVVLWNMPDPYQGHNDPFGGVR